MTLDFIVEVPKNRTVAHNFKNTCVRRMVQKQIYDAAPLKEYCVIVVSDRAVLFSALKTM